MENLQLFSLADMEGRPQEMFKMKGNVGFYCHLPYPLPEHVVIMAKGDWPMSLQLSVQMQFTQTRIIHVGLLTNTCRCIMWDRNTSKENLPTSSMESKPQATVLVAPPELLCWELKTQLASLLQVPSASQTPAPDSSSQNSPVTSPSWNSSPGSPVPKSGGDSPSQKTSAAVTKSPAQSVQKAAAASAVVQNSLSPQPKGRAEDKKNLQAVNESTPQTQVSMPAAAKKPRKGRGKQAGKVDASTPTVDPIPTKATTTKATTCKTKRSKSPESPSEDPTPIKKRNGAASKAAAAGAGTPSSKGGRQEWRKRNLVKDSAPAAVDSSSMAGANTQPARCKDVTSRVGQLPSNRWGHTMVWVGGQQAVLIGGQGDKQQLAKDSIWSLTTDTRRWKTMDVTSDSQKPECRMGHSATYDPTLRCIYVYGGSKHLKWFHDVHMFDMDKMTWQLMKVNGKAPMRAYHSATLHRHEVWVFGGVYPRPSPNPDGCSNELHIFSPINENWYAPLVTGDKPDPRSGHSANLIEDQLVVFGGWDFPICFNDLHILDMTTLDWTKPVTQGTPPKPRSWHGSCVLSNKRILIHGGYDGDNALADCFVFTLKTLTWTKISMLGAPIPRAGHTALCLPYTIDNGEEDEVLLFGGGDNDGTFFNDLYSLYLPFHPTPAPTPPPASASTPKQAA